jgi:hypothetical protein
MGSNGGVAIVSPNEGDCLVLGITLLIVSFLLCCGWNWWDNFVSKASTLQLWRIIILIFKIHFDKIIIIIMKFWQ